MVGPSALIRLRSVVEEVVAVGLAAEEGISVAAGTAVVEEATVRLPRAPKTLLSDLLQAVAAMTQVVVVSLVSMFVCHN